MKKGLFRFLAFAVVATMMFGLLPISAFAENAFVSETHDVFSSTTSTIAPGVTQSINYAYAKDGKQMVYYVATADIARDDVIVQTSYFNQFENGAFAMSKLTDQMAYADELFTNKESEFFISEHYKAVVGTNGDFYNMTTGQPSGAFVINGIQSSNKANNRPWFAIFEDGTALCGYNNTDWDKAVTAHGAAQQAVGGSQVIVYNGADTTVNASGSYNTERHSRTCVGVTADGQVVMMVLDGRQEPFSCGGSMHELAQIMLEAGCVMAINLDGGGSTTYAARPEGKNEVEIINRPSDGSERAISNALIIASLVAPSDVFDRAVLTAQHEYVTPYSTVNVAATGVSPAGTTAQIPENAVWQLTDASLGTIDNGVFTSNGSVGTAVVQLVVDGVVVGETKINVVIPDIAFDFSEMTVPYNKTFKLSVSGTTNNGLNKVVLKDSDLIFELGNPLMGTIDGAYYTTCSETAGVTGGTVSVKCVYDATKTDTTSITFGKASVIAEDFEDGNMDGWSAKSAYARAGKGDLTFGRFESYDLNLVTAATGKVRNGNYALEIVADFSTTTASGYKAIKYTLPAIDLTGATAFGMWMYLPVGDVHNLEFDIGGYEYYIEDDANIGDEGWYYIMAPAATVGTSLTTFTIYMTDADASYFNVFNKYSIYIDDLTIDYSNATEDREIPKFSNVTVVTGLDNETAMNGQVYADNVITVKAYAAENLTGNYTGLDISTAKVFVDGIALASSAYYCDERGVINVGNLTLADGTHSFRFEIQDKAGNTGFITKKIIINTSEGDVYLERRSDVPQPLAGSIDYYDIIAKNIEKIDSFTVTIDLDTLNKWEFDGAEVAYGFSMDYSIDPRSNTATISITKTGSVEATGSAVLLAIPVRVWSTPSYLMDKYINAGLVSNSTSSNESTVISTPYVMWQTDRTRLVRIEMCVDSAVVSYADGSVTTFASLPINVITEHNRYRTEGYYTVDGEYVTGDPTFCKQGKDNLHVHSTAVAVADKAATCTEAGYTGRTCCEDCGSVIDWGTTIPATGHTYEVVDGVLKCSCDKHFNGEYTDGKTYVEGVPASGWMGDSYFVDGVAVTGIQLIDGYYYNFGDNGICENQTKYTGKFYVAEENVYRYAQFGVIGTGWKQIEDEWYFFSRLSTNMLTGAVTVDSVDYVFDENGVLIKGNWVDTSNGRRYFWAGNPIRKQFFEVDGKTYFSNSQGFIYYGLQKIVITHGDTGTYYFFDENTGALVEKLTGDGLRIYGQNNDVVVFLKDGVPQYAGLVQDAEGNYYYINSSLLAVKNTSYTIGAAKTNGLLEAGRYEFGADGKMIVEQEPPVEEPSDPNVKNGLIIDEDGEIRYYVDDVATYAGLVKDANGNYYYINSTKKAVKNTFYTIGEARTNGLMAAGRYQFGADGKMIVEQEPPVEEPDVNVKNGLIIDEDGEIRYYVDGVATYAGLVKDAEGNYYYINSTKKAVKNTGYTIGEARTNGLMAAGRYEFGADGKMIVDSNEEEQPEVTVKNGLVIDEDGEIRYYVNGVATYAGLVQDAEGNYYYINSTKKAVKNTGYTIGATKTNGLLEAGRYQFGADGKMIQNG